MTNTVIRNGDTPTSQPTSDRPVEKSSRGSLWLWVFAVLAIGATIAAAIQGQSLGYPAFILLLGISVVSMLAVMTIFFNIQSAKTPEPLALAAQDTSLAAAFSAQTTPSLIVLGGRPIKANPAYEALAKELGIEFNPDLPLSVERLFARKEKTASSHSPLTFGF